jgi:aryl-alcohol dehydrogenase-like predicted oxidoreductase
MLHYRTLGSTGLKIAEVGFGSWPIGGGWVLGGVHVGYGPTDDNVSKQAIRKALDLGINLLDSADAYGAGHSEELIGQVLKDWPARDELVIATKVGNQRRDPLPSVKNFERSYVISACEASLRRMNVEVIDLYQLHNPSLEIIRQGDIFETLDVLRRDGKIRFVGVSVTTPEEGIELIQMGVVDALQIIYNIVDRRPEWELFPLAQEKGIGILARTPLSSGALTGKYTSETVFPDGDWRANWLKGDILQEAIAAADRLRPLVQPPISSLAELALRFSLSHPAVSAIIPGAKTPAQAESNAQAGDGKGLPAEVLEQIDALELYGWGLEGSKDGYRPPAR